MKTHSFARLLMIICGLALACIPTFAQQITGQIEGTIFDAQGAAVVGAEITVTDPNTGFTRTTVAVVLVSKPFPYCHRERTT